MSKEEKLHPKIESVKQSSSITSPQVFALRKLSNDELVDKKTSLGVLMVRKFYVRFLLYCKATYDSRICFLGVGSDTVYIPYKNSICVDVNEKLGDHVIVMNVEKNMNEFKKLLKDKKMEYVVAEGVFSYLKKEKVLELIDFLQKEKIKLLFSIANKRLIELMARFGLVKKGLFKTVYEDVEKKCKNYGFVFGDNVLMKGYFGIKKFDKEIGLETGSNYYMIHNLNG